MTLSKEDVRRIARLAHLEYPRLQAKDGTWSEPEAHLMNDDTLHRLAKELDRVLEHVNELTQLDLDGVEATPHGVALPTRLRDDVAQDPLDRDAALTQAPARMGDAIVVPKVVE